MDKSLLERKKMWPTSVMVQCTVNLYMRFCQQSQGGVSLMVIEKSMIRRRLIKGLRDRKKMRKREDNFCKGSRVAGK